MAFRFVGTGPVVGKAIAIGLITFILMVPLSMLRSLVNERTEMRDQAFRTVAAGWGGDVTTSGPMLIIPADRAERSEKGERILVRRHLHVLPTSLKIDVEILGQPDRRKVGIYEVPVYSARAKISGEFAADAVSAAVAQNGGEATLHFDRARLRLPLSDTKSLRDLSLADFDGRPLRFAPGRPGVFPGIDADVKISPAAAPLKFEFEMVLAGARDLSILPLGAQTNATIVSAWPDPKFIGESLPTSRTVDATGFKAEWHVLELNRKFNQAWLDVEFNEELLAASAFGVQLFQSVDIYQSSERAVKYALFFIALTFLSFFAWEQISKAPVHPMQYLLIGLALSVFYLLLIALSEHVAFMIAYWSAAAALILLLGAYTAAALHGAKRGIAVGGGMSLVYGILYMLILSDEYALLMGAITLFVTLAIVMLATRKVQWYREQTVAAE